MQIQIQNQDQIHKWFGWSVILWQTRRLQAAVDVTGLTVLSWCKVWHWVVADVIGLTASRWCLRLNSAVDDTDPTASKWCPTWHQPARKIPTLLIGDDGRDELSLLRKPSALLSRQAFRDGFSLPWTVPAILPGGNDGQDAVKPNGIGIAIFWKTMQCRIIDVSCIKLVHQNLWACNLHAGSQKCFAKVE